MTLLCLKSGLTKDLFACKKTETNPDVLCLSKGLTAGYMPLAVTLCTNKIYDQFLSEDLDKTLLHGHTFTANPLACAVANKSLQLFQEEKTLNLKRGDLIILQINQKSETTN